MSYPFDYVINHLKKGHVRFNISQISQDSAAIILPDYNRILGVWPDLNRSCPFWINEKFLENPNGELSNWPNPGGHRIWMAPEREFFISDLNKPFDTYKVPEQMDPGRYEYHYEKEMHFFSNKMDLYAYHSKINVPVMYERNIRFLKNREISETINVDSKECKCIAYQDDVSLRTKTCFKTGLWSLIQVPLAGWICVPLNDKASYEEFFGESRGYVEINNGRLAIKLDSIANDFKIGMRGTMVKDRIFHVQKRNDRTFIIIKIFEKGQDNDYVDTPWKFTDIPPSAAQIFCGGNWGFAELEIHAPVIRNGSDFCSFLKSKIFVVELSALDSDDIVTGIFKITQ